MKRALLLATFIFVCLEGRAQEFFVRAPASQTLSARAQIDSLLTEFGEDFDSQHYTLPLSLAASLGKTVRMTAITYWTQDPLENKILASGLVAYPVKGAFRGTVEVAPFSKEKGLSGSKRLYTLETLPSLLGYVVIVPDTIGYGISEDEVIPLLLNRNTAQVSADMRQAVTEYFRSVGERRALPSETSLFGYSLGAPGTLALACHYASHPELGVKLRQIYLGGGAYDPGLSLRGTFQLGENGFLLFPAPGRISPTMSPSMSDTLSRIHMFPRNARTAWYRNSERPATLLFSTTATGAAPITKPPPDPSWT